MVSCIINLYAQHFCGRDREGQLLAAGYSLSCSCYEAIDTILLDLPDICHRRTPVKLRLDDVLHGVSSSMPIFSKVSRNKNSQFNVIRCLWYQILLFVSINPSAFFTVPLVEYGFCAPCISFVVIIFHSMVPGTID